MSVPPLRREFLRICSIGAISGLMGCLANSKTPENEASNTEEAETTILDNRESTVKKAETTTPRNTLPEFVIWPEEDLTLTIQISESKTDSTVYDKTQTLSAAEELTVEQVFERKDYEITLTMDDETIWQGYVGTCEYLEISVESSGNAEITEHFIC